MSAVLAENQSTALDLVPARDSAVMPGFNSNANWELAQRVAKAFASSTLVPELYRGQQGIANCLIALEMANRMGASPLLVMQNLYVVHGNPSWSAKFLIATFNQCGRFSALRYEWNAERTSCRAWATEKATGDRLDGPTVTVAMAKDEGWSTKSGSKWKNMPELMLMYRAATFFVRTYAPELSMGLQTTDEVEDVHGIEPAATGLAAVRAHLGGADPETGEIKRAEDMTSVDKAAAVQSYAVRADRIVKATDPEVAALELDAARDLPADQYDALVQVYTDKFGKA